MSGTIEHIEQDAQRAIRNLPDAHASWQFWWRNAQFRRAIGAVEKAIYALDVEKLSDSRLEVLEKAVRIVLKSIEIHVAGLGSAVQDKVDREYFRNIISRMEVALEGLEQGLSPDPSKRPSDEQLLDRFAAMLKRQPLNLPDRTGCAPSSTS